MPELPSDWDTAVVATCLAPIPAGSTKIQRRHYRSAGRFPIVDQSQQLIAGWTDDATAVIDEPLPVIVFGDHTRILKYIDFPFARGADGTQLLKPKKGIDPRFFFYACRNLDLRSRGYNRHFSVLKEQSIQLPPDREQKRIADILNRVEVSLAQEARLIDTASKARTAVMNRLFTRGLRGEAQKETEIGLVPESWVLTPAEQIFKLTSGKSRPDDLSPEATSGKPFPVLGGNGVMGYSSEWTVDSNRILVIGRVGEYCGVVRIVSGKVWITDNALYAREWLNASADIGYVAAFLEYFDLNRFKRMAGQPLVTQGMINEHRFPLPSLDEQREIVAILDAIDRKIDLHKRKRDVLEELFRSLLHKLMTGEVRVNDLSISEIAQ